MEKANLIQRLLTSGTNLQSCIAYATRYSCGGYILCVIILVRPRLNSQNWKRLLFPRNIHILSHVEDRGLRSWYELSWWRIKQIKTTTTAFKFMKLIKSDEGFIFSCMLSCGYWVALHLERLPCPSNASAVRKFHVPLPISRYSIGKFRHPLEKQSLAVADNFGVLSFEKLENGPEVFEGGIFYSSHRCSFKQFIFRT